MADYIDRQAAIAALREFAEECKGSTEAATAAAMAISVISRLPGPWVTVAIWETKLQNWVGPGSEEEWSENARGMVVAWMELPGPYQEDK